MLCALNDCNYQMNIRQEQATRTKKKQMVRLKWRNPRAENDTQTHDSHTHGIGIRLYIAKKIIRWFFTWKRL